MRVVHNGLFLTQPHTGIGQYTRHLLAALAEASDDEHVVIVPEAVDFDVRQIRLHELPVRRHLAGYGVALDAWETSGISRLLPELGADAYHAHYPTGPVSATLPTFMTVHDLIPWQRPEYRRGLRRRFKLRRQLAGIKRADHLLTVSETVKQDLIGLMGREGSRVTVTYDGVDQSLLAPLSEAEIAGVQKRYDLHRPYLFYIGGFDTRKNVRALVNAFVRSELAPTHDLVLAGAVTARPSALYRDYADILAMQPGIGEALKLPGFVAEADKKAFLAGAAAFVYPSLAEGFGIPILEALAVGAPVLAADIPVNRELFASAATLKDLSEPDRFARALQEIIRPAGAAPGRTGRQLAQRFSWEAAAKRTLAAYRQAAR